MINHVADWCSRHLAPFLAPCLTPLINGRNCRCWRWLQHWALATTPCSLRHSAPSSHTMIARWRVWSIKWVWLQRLALKCCRPATSWHVVVGSSWIAPLWCCCCCCCCWMKSDSSATCFRCCSVDSTSISLRRRCRRHWSDFRFQAMRWLALSRPASLRHAIVCWARAQAVVWSYTIFALIDRQW